MKIRIAVSAEREQAVTEALLRAGFELDDEAELVVLENDRFASHLPVRDEAGNRLHLAVEDIVSIESFGHSVVVRTAEGSYQSADRLYQLCLILDPKQFLRISNSVIIQRRQHSLVCTIPLHKRRTHRHADSRYRACRYEMRQINILCSALYISIELVSRFFCEARQSLDFFL